MSQGKRYPDKVGKAALMEVILAAYPVGIGPCMIAELTGYRERQVRRYAKDLGLSFGRGVHSTIPNPVPYELLMALMKAGCGNYHFTRISA